MKINVYILVFGAITAIIVLAGLSIPLFNMNLAQQGNITGNYSIANLHNYGPAANIQGIMAWINSPPINISKLRGRVVIVDFWTYSCINCIRTIPFLNALQSTYGKDGLVIIGVHTPEFQFEHNLTNVEDAVKRFNITYPVALDNNYSTWDAYGNEYWPADYVIDKNGNIRYESFGETPTSFNQTQQIVRAMLENASNTQLPSAISISDALNFSQPISPEMYFGYQELETGRTNYFGNIEGIKPNNVSDYIITNISQVDTIYLSGNWYNAQDSMIAEGNGSKIFLIYRAKNVNVVASGNGGNSTISILLNGTEPANNYLGSNVKISNGNAVAQIGTSQLYSLVSAPAYGIHELEINASAGFRIYTFTFG